jgi:hypothetical protein
MDVNHCDTHLEGKLLLCVEDRTVGQLYKVGSVYRAAIKPNWGLALESLDGGGRWVTGLRAKWAIVDEKVDLEELM